MNRRHFTGWPPPFSAGLKTASASPRPQSPSPGWVISPFGAPKSNSEPCATGFATCFLSLDKYSQLHAASRAYGILIEKYNSRNTVEVVGRARWYEIHQALPPSACATKNHGRPHRRSGRFPIC